MTDDKRPVGRPSKYTPDLIAKAREYADNNHDFPMIAELALELEVSRDTLYAWALEPDKQEFSDILEKVMAKQEVKLAKGALVGDYHAGFAKMMMTKHGYSDRQDITSDSKPLATAPMVIRLVGPDE
jgi:hypothetical protein